MDALFAQLNWDINARWDAGLGVRWEAFDSANGYFSRDVASTPQFDLVSVPKTSRREVSPKFSVGYQASETWRFAWALGKAYRFPIVEELFSQYSAYNAVSVANPELQPEDGLHQNLMIERQISGGYLRVNVFQESIKDVVESQSETLPGGLTVRTFIPVDEIETVGIEFIANVDDVLIPNLDMRFNLVNTDSEIVKNRPDPSIEGNVYPRMPEWRGNLLLTYNFSSRWNAGCRTGSVSPSPSTFHATVLTRSPFRRSTWITGGGAGAARRLCGGAGRGESASDDARRGEGGRFLWRGIREGLNRVFGSYHPQGRRRSFWKNRSKVRVA
jgi:iron complex outermembrane receptor protein